MENAFLMTSKCIILMCLIIVAKTQLIKKAPDFFNSCIYIYDIVTCCLGYKDPSIGGLFTCPTPNVIPRVDKYGVVVT